MASAHDEHFMRYALNLARAGLGRTAPNPSVGCVIVKNGVVIAAARTADSGRPHAETQALAMAGKAAKGADVYVSLEPCSHIGKTGPCAKALIEAGVARVISACRDRNPKVSGTGHEMLRDAGIAVIEDVLRAEAEALNKGFFLTQTQQRPFVTLKLAASLDGKIAMASGESQWITGAQARRKSHQLRSSHDAIMAGIGTVNRDDPQFTTRYPGLIHKAVRVIADSSLRMDITAKLVQSAQDEPLWIMHGAADETKKARLKEAGARLFECNTRDLKALLKILAENGITRLLVEGGAGIHSSFLTSGLFDQMALFRASSILGGGAKDAFAGLDIMRLSDSLKLVCTGIEILGKDRLEIYEAPQ